MTLMKLRLTLCTSWGMDMGRVAREEQSSLAVVGDNTMMKLEPGKPLGIAQLHLSWHQFLARLFEIRQGWIGIAIPLVQPAANQSVGPVSQGEAAHEAVCAHED